MDFVVLAVSFEVAGTPIVLILAVALATNALFTSSCIDGGGGGGGKKKKKQKHACIITSIVKKI